MAITNTDRPNSSIINSANMPVQYETFDTLTTTFDTETRTFDEMGTNWTNATKYQTLIWLSSLLPWTMLTPWIGTDSEITNQSRPV